MERIRITKGIWSTNDRFTVVSVSSSVFIPVTDSGIEPLFPCHALIINQTHFAVKICHTKLTDGSNKHKRGGNYHIISTHKKNKQCGDHHLTAVPRDSMFKHMCTKPKEQIGKVINIYYTSRFPIVNIGISLM